jgi:hypothetical protein
MGAKLNVLNLEAALPLFCQEGFVSCTKGENTSYNTGATIMDNVPSHHQLILLRTPVLQGHLLPSS